MNAEGVPFEALKELSRVCFGGYRLPARSRFGEGRPSEAGGGATGFARGAPPHEMETTIEASIKGCAPM